VHNRVSFLPFSGPQVVYKWLALVVLLSVHHSCVSLRSHVEERAWSLRNQRCSFRFCWNGTCLLPFSVVESHLFILKSFFHSRLRSIIWLELLLVKVSAWKRSNQPSGCAGSLHSIILIASRQFWILLSMLFQICLICLLGIYTPLHSQMLHEFANGHEFPKPFVFIVIKSDLCNFSMTYLGFEIIEGFNFKIFRSSISFSA